MRISPVFNHTRDFVWRGAGVDFNIHRTYAEIAEQNGSRVADGDRQSLKKSGLVCGDNGMQMSRSFKDIADEYCAWVERRAVRDEVGVWLAQILAELIHVVYSFPDDGLADAGAGEEDGYKKRDYNEVRESLPKLPFQWYREVFESTDLENEESVMGELYDDVADIYSDLRRGLFVYEQISQKEAERYWRQSFRYHWGEHATGALRALYQHLRDKAYE